MDYRITEVDRSPLPVGETPVVEYLQQNVEHIRVRFFHFIQQDDGIGTTAHRLGQATALFIADVSRRRTDSDAGTECFSIKLGHIDTHHRVVAIEHKVSQRFTQLGFTDPGWTEGTGTNQSAGSDRTARRGCGEWRWIPLQPPHPWPITR